jgi:hypothetical protein
MATSGLDHTDSHLSYRPEGRDALIDRTNSIVIAVTFHVLCDKGSRFNGAVF